MINDWKIRRFLIFALSIQLTFWMFQIFDFQIFGFYMLIIRQVINFIYIIFIPGITILRILKIHKLDNIEMILYSVGLSIASLMFIGFFMNTVYPFIGINKPISIKYLIITLSIFISILYIVNIKSSYEKDKDEKDYETTIKDVYCPMQASFKIILILLVLILSLSIFGTYLANYYQDNFVLMIMLVLIAITIILIMVTNKSQKIYYMAIFIISLSLLFHRSLISSYLTGWDIQTEYYLSNLVMINSFWDLNIVSNVNAMLSIVILAPIYSLSYNINLIWIYKIMYPILFSLTPIGLFKIFQKQTNDKVAFLSCFFFISVLTYYAEMIGLARQEIAELFLVLIIMTMLDENLNGVNKSIMYITFGFSLAVSHYGMSYLFLFSLIVIIFIYKNSKSDIITGRFILLFSTFTLAWYVYVAEGSAIITITRIGNHIKDSMFELLNPQTVEGMNIIVRNELTPMRQITKYLYIITQIFIVIGIFITTKYNKICDTRKLEFRFQKNYLNFSYVNIIILFLGIVVPYVASSLNTTRLFQITLIFLAPFSIIGGLALVNYITKISIKNSMLILSVFFSVFLLFNSGFIYEISKEPSSSIALNYTADYPRFNEVEVSTAHLIKEKIVEENVDGIENGNLSKVFSDEYRDLLLSSMIGEKNYLTGDEEIIMPPPKSFLFLGKENVQNGKMILVSREYKTHNIYLKNSKYYKKFPNMNKIIDSGESQILLTIG